MADTFGALKNVITQVGTPGTSANNWFTQNGHVPVPPQSGGFVGNVVDTVGSLGSGGDPQNPPPGWRPQVDPGGYIPTESQRAGEQQQFQDMLRQFGGGGFKSPVGSDTGMQYLSGVAGNGQAHQNVARGVGGAPSGGNLFGAAMGASVPQMQTMGQAFGGAMSPQVVLMRAPDGSMQHVDSAHVDHYTGLGAQVMNGSSYGQQGGY